MLSKKLKKGFMSVETVIVGFIILSAGFSGIMMLSNTGKETVNNKIAQLEEVDGIEKIENGFIFAWNESMNGWTIKGWTNDTGGAATIPAFFSDGRPVVEIADSAFIGQGITSLSLPSTLLRLGESSFKDNLIQTLVIPDNINEVGNTVFENNKLVSVTFEGTIPETRGLHVFRLNPTLLSNSVYLSSVDFYVYAYTNMYSNTFNLQERYFTVNPIDESVEGDFAYFWDNTMNGWVVMDYINRTDKTVVIPANRADGLPVVSLGHRAFMDDKVTSVSIPSTVKTIQNNTFTGNMLTSVTLPSGLTSIGHQAFHGNQLTAINLPATLTSLGLGTFYNNKLTSVTIPNSLTVIPYEAFSRNNISSLTLPNTLTTIEELAFSTNSLTNVTFPATLKTLGNQSFYGNKLTSIRFNGAVPTTLGFDIFWFNDPLLPEGSIRVPNAYLSAFQNVADRFPVNINRFIGY